VAAKRDVIDEGIVLLLVFKDPVPDEPARGFPLVAESVTITLHRAKVGGTTAPVVAPQLELPFPAADPDLAGAIGSPEVRGVPENCFVWGWWRKAWEHNDRLLDIVARRCEAGEKPIAILYNQYLRKAYKAIVHNVHYCPKGRTVEIPPAWRGRCPDYYVNQPHKCGAFFVLELQRRKDGLLDHEPRELLRGYRVDAVSFPLLEEDFRTVVSVSEGAIDVCRDLVDNCPTASALKASAHTMFALRETSQKEITRKALTRGISDLELASAFRRTDQRDVEEILVRATLKDWKVLADRPKTLEAIAANSAGRILRFDLFLAAWALTDPLMTKALTRAWGAGGFRRKSKEHIEKFRELTVKWLIIGDAFEKREAGSRLLRWVWEWFRERYDLKGDLGAYFESLPQLEEIAYSTQHGLRAKFYRDHLNHNIRAGLLAAYLASELVKKADVKVNHVAVVFFAGVFHDVGHPLASYESIGEAIERALKSLNLEILSRAHSILKHEGLLQRDLCRVSFISGVKGLERVTNTGTILPGMGDNAVDIATDPGVLYEQMACAICDTHGLLSAAVILNAAVGSGSVEDRVRQIRSVFAVGKKKGESRRGCELLNVIQCIALHDRQVAMRLLGDRDNRETFPIRLAFTDFCLPTVTIIADELQEWGRPIGDPSRALARDCQIEVIEQGLRAVYTIDIQARAIGNAKFSFLEYFMAKVRCLSRIDLGKPDLQLFSLHIHIDGEMYLRACAEGSVFCFERSEPPVWPTVGVDEMRRTRPAYDQPLFCFARNTERKGEPVHLSADFVKLKVGKEVIAPDWSQWDSIRVKNVSVQTHPPTITIETTVYSIEGEIEAYYFGELAQETQVKDGDRVCVEGPAGYLVIKVTEIRKLQRGTTIGGENERDMHLLPPPHFLDLDWRFSFEGVMEVLEFVRAHGPNGRVCYLGCPSLALHHQNLGSKMAGIEAQLIDKGHHAIDAWIHQGFLSHEMVIKYDVCDPLLSRLTRSFDMVIMDPPWYEPLYRLFWRRALQMVKPNGLIGVAEYPGYKPGKLEMFENLRSDMIGSLEGTDFFASIIISYTPPPFETSWQGHLKFTHSAFHTYRPSYMDFYHIESVRTNRATDDSKPEHVDWLGKVVPLDAGHYLRCREDIEASLGQSKVAFACRRDLRLMKKHPEDLIAWSTRNTLVSTSSDANEAESVTVSDLDDLKKRILAWENDAVAR